MKRSKGQKNKRTAQSRRTRNKTWEFLLKEWTIWGTIVSRPSLFFPSPNCFFLEGTVLHSRVPEAKRYKSPPKKAATTYPWFSKVPLECLFEILRQTKKNSPRKTTTTLRQPTNMVCLKGEKKQLLMKQPPQKHFFFRGHRLLKTPWLRPPGTTRPHWGLLSSWWPLKTYWEAAWHRWASRRRAAKSFFFFFCKD